MSNTITISKIDSLCCKPKPVILTFKTTEGDEVNIKLTPWEALPERIAFVEAVSKATFIDGEFRPSTVEPIFFAMYLKNYTNISVPTKTGDAEDKLIDLEHITKWYQFTEIRDVFTGSDIVGDHYCKLFVQVRECIDFKIKKMQTDSPINRVISKFSDVIDKLSDAFDGDVGELLKAFSTPAEAEDTVPNTNSPDINVSLLESLIKNEQDN